MLRVFLVSRGNMRELERHLGVSYPTARLRFADLRARLGMADPVHDAATAAPREDVLRRLAAGELDVEAGAELLGEQLERGVSDP